MSEATEHFAKAVHRVETYDDGLKPETHIARGLHALAIQIDRLEALLATDDGSGTKE